MPSNTHTRTKKESNITHSEIKRVIHLKGKINIIKQTSVKEDTRDVRHPEIV